MVAFFLPCVLALKIPFPFYSVVICTCISILFICIFLCICIYICGTNQSWDIKQNHRAMTDDFTSIALYCLCICLFPFPRCFFGICIYICISSVFVFVLHKMQMIAKTQGNNWWLLNYQIIGRAGTSPLHHLDKIQTNNSFFFVRPSLT